MIEISLKLTGKSSVSSDSKTGEKTVGYSATAKPNGKSTASSGIVEKPKEKTAVSAPNPMNRDTATALSSAHGGQLMFFRDVSLGPREADLRLEQESRLQREFYSHANHRRHSRTHRRPRKPEKDSSKEMEALGDFGDKVGLTLSVDESKPCSG